MKLRPGLLSLLATSLAACATGSPPPPTLGQTFTPPGFSEPDLSRPQAVEGYRRRLRLYLSPPFRRQVVIRVDTDSSGRGVATFARREPADEGGGWEITETQRRRVSVADLAKLDALVRTSGLWATSPEFWQRLDGAVCLDGMEVTLERATAEGYGISEANLPCYVPQSMLGIAVEMVRIADPGDREVLGWLQ